MTSPKTSRPPAPAGDPGWIGRVVSGIGIAVVVAVGTALSPSGTSAGHDWSSPSVSGAVERPWRLGEDRPIAGPRGDLIGIDRSTPVLRRAPRGPQPASTATTDPETVAARDRGLSRVRLAARLLDRVRSGLERWSGVVVTSAAR